MMSEYIMVRIHHVPTATDIFKRVIENKKSDLHFEFLRRANDPGLLGMIIDDCAIPYNILRDCYMATSGEH